MKSRQKRFADEYIISLNAEQSAIKAGYSERYARASAYKLLANVGIKTYIEERLKQLESESIASAKEILEHLTAAMRGEVFEEVVVVIRTGYGCSESISVQKQVSGFNRLKAAELLGKRYGLFTDKFNLDGALPVVIVGADKLED